VLPLPLRGTPTSQVASFVGMAARCDMEAGLKGTRSDGVLTDTATIRRKRPTMPKSLSHLTVIIQSLHPLPVKSRYRNVAFSPELGSAPVFSFFRFALYHPVHTLFR
jgi:hypothetical protein